MTDAFDEALQTLVAALVVAESRRDLPALGDLLQRLAYVVADRGADHRRALALAREATDYHFLAGDLNGAGKTLVDRGLWLYKLGQLDEAIEMQQVALEYLEADEHQNRCTALHGLAVYYRELGELEKAQEYAGRARELAPHVGPALVAKLDWLDARVAVDQERDEDAEELLRETVRRFAPESPFEAARATIELVRVLFRQGRHGAARDTAKTMARFLEPLENRSRIAASTLVDLMLCAESDSGLTDAELDRAAAVLEAEREGSREPSRSGR